MKLSPITPAPISRNHTQPVRFSQSEAPVAELPLEQAPHHTISTQRVVGAGGLLSMAVLAGFSLLTLRSDLQAAKSYLTGRDSRTLELFDKLTPNAQLETLEAALVHNESSKVQQALLPKLSDLQIPSTQKARLILQTLTKGNDGLLLTSSLKKALDKKDTALFEAAFKEGVDLLQQPDLPTTLRHDFEDFLKQIPVDQKNIPQLPIYPSPAYNETHAKLVQTLETLEKEVEASK